MTELTAKQKRDREKAIAEKKAYDERMAFEENKKKKEKIKPVLDFGRNQPKYAENIESWKTVMSDPQQRKDYVDKVVMPAFRGLSDFFFWGDDK